ncbi:two-component regulator propeller domain-containing protein, partial [Aquiflexum sp.]|uniref:sensor histidine kinase n=1 Tax=Aquiflexum sp. TaxID=1872584 RepID=UPI0035934CAC
MNQKTFGHIKAGTSKLDLSHPSVGAIHEDRQKNLWVITNDGVLHKFNFQKSTLVKYPANEHHSGFKGNMYGGILEDDEGYLYLYTWNWYHHRFHPEKISTNPRNAKFQILVKRNSEILKDEPGGWAPRGAALSKDGGIWIAYYDGGLDKFYPRRGVFEHFRHRPGCKECISSDALWSVFEAKDGSIYVGFETAGFDRMDQLGKTTNYQQCNSDLKSNSVRCFHEDRQGNIWIGTSGGGLSMFQPTLGKVTSWTVEDGLADDVVYGILEDRHGRLWLSTENGISCFSAPNQDHPVGFFKNYNHTDGLQNNEFNINSYFQSEDGFMYFGGSNGITFFHPDSIRDNQILPEVRLTGLKLFNKPIIPGQSINGQVVLTKKLSQTKLIELNHRNKDFTIEFTSTHFSAPVKNRFFYNLQGFDDDWKSTNSQKRFATYTNLNPGKYTFMVKAANCDGLINENYSTIDIVIFPPWWWSIYAKIFYAVFLFLMIIGIYRIIHLRAEYKHQVLLQRATFLKNKEIAEKAHEIDKMKLNFFMNVSHEFRTPLTLILGPLEKLLSIEGSQKYRDQFEVMQRNAKRLLRLINQLLDMGKMEKGSIRVENEPLEIVEAFYQVCHSFELISQQKNISFSIFSAARSKWIWMDEDKIEKILYNLLSNAFNHTPEGGKIATRLIFYSENKIGLEVENTGSFIHTDDLPYIFEAFYQAGRKK